LQRTLEGSSLETIRHMVASGLGVTVLPCTATRHALVDERLLLLRPFDGPAPMRRVVIVWRRNFPRPRAIEAVRQAILDAGLPGVTSLPGERPVFH
jgi:LysR family hydrogen peroxide-inducible transcriptional activator